ncbi:MAG: hypothetical protein ACRDQ0_17285 [Pseudonocardia sp.]
MSGPQRELRRTHAIVRQRRWSITWLCWWQHPGYIGVRRRDFYAWRKA